MRFSPRQTTLLLCTLSIFFAGCPSKRKIASPEPPVPRSGNQEALEQFEESQSQFRRGEGEVDPARFETIVKEFPNDPIVPHALLYAGMSSVRSGEYKKAIANLDQLVARQGAEKALVDRGLLYRGIAKNYLKDHDGALTDLEAGKDSVGQVEGEREEWLAAMAVAHEGRGSLGKALNYYDEWHRKGRASERAFIVARVEEIVGLLIDADLERAYESLADKKGPAAAFLGRRHAGALRDRGEQEAAVRVTSETEGARKAFGLTVSVGGNAGAGDPNRLGGILPLSGRQSRIGEYSGRGLALAASFGDKSGEGARGGWPRRFSLVLRDSSSSPEKAVADLKELAAEDVIAVIGPVRRDASRAVAQAASEISVPVVTLSGVPAETDSPYVFHAVHSPEMRAQALARHAFNLGVRDFAILRPKVKYGDAVGAAFRAEVERLGGTVIVDVRYAEGTTSFKDYTSKLKKPWQAIFVPDSAKRLELIAPALAIANFVARPFREKGGKGRSILLLSTAEALAPTFVDAAARYSVGAILAPGFYADSRDGAIGPFVDRYTRAFGVPPTSTDAYAFDAALAVRAVVEGGAANRGEVASGLAKVKVGGLTGAVEFDGGTHRRKDSGLLYEVQKISAGGHAIRVVR